MLVVYQDVFIFICPIQKKMQKDLDYTKKIQMKLDNILKFQLKYLFFFKKIKTLRMIVLNILKKSLKNQNLDNINLNDFETYYRNTWIEY